MNKSKKKINEYYHSRDESLMILVPAGVFFMGSTEEGAEKAYHQSGLHGALKEWFFAETPIQKRVVNSFFIDKYQVTVRQFVQFTEETGYQTDSEKSGYGWKWDIRTQKWKRASGWNWRTPMGIKYDFQQGPNHPAVQVSWNDAIEYCKWSGKRLLTEVEWEYACRAGTETRFYWGDDLNYSEIDRYAWHAGNSGNRSHEVGKKFPNNWGLYDMCGNVWEWVADWYMGYPGTLCTGVKFGQFWRVCRGGAWFFHPAYMRSAYRGSTMRGNYIGFRCAKDIT